MALRNNLNSQTKADLISFNSAIDGQSYTCLGDTVMGDSYLREYYYDASSSTTDDGENVLAATGMSGVGRFIKIKDDYSNLKNTPPSSKRQETYSGITNSSGIYAVTFGTSYSVAPNIQVNIIGGTNKMTQLTTVTSTGFSIYVQSRADVIGLLPTYSNVNAQAVDVLVTEK